MPGMFNSVTTLNGEIKIVSNLSKEWAKSVLDVGVSYSEDLDQVIDLLKQIGRELVAEEPWKSAILEPSQIFPLPHRVLIWGDEQSNAKWKMRNGK